MSDATITREDLQMLAETAERFAKTEIAPHLEAWEKAGELPRDLHRRAAELGLLGLGYPEALGGTPAPWSLRNVLAATALPLENGFLSSLAMVIRFSPCLASRPSSMTWASSEKWPLG